MSVRDELDRFCAFAERFLTDERGRPLVIEGFQREVLTDYFAGTRELVVILSKKNGKTSLFAGLALWHLVTAPFADVAILAASRDQAGKLIRASLVVITSSMIIPTAMRARRCRPRCAWPRRQRRRGASWL